MVRQRLARAVPALEHFLGAWRHRSVLADDHEHGGGFETQAGGLLETGGQVQSRKLRSESLAQGREGSGLRIRRAHHETSRRLHALADQGVGDWRAHVTAGPRSREGIRRRLPRQRDQGRVLLLRAGLVQGQGLHVVQLSQRERRTIRRCRRFPAGRTST